MLSSLTLRIITSAVVTILAGMFLGSRIIVSAGFLLIIFVFVGLQLKPPGKVEVERLFGSLDVHTDDVVSVSARVRVKDGVGIVIVVNALPAEFKLVEGSNFKVLWKGFSELDTTFNFSFQCSKRGVYRIAMASYEVQHPLLLTPTQTTVSSETQTLVVWPHSLNVKRVREKRAFTKMPIPSDSRILLGTQTTDFKEIRGYREGDPYKRINWKATARLRGNDGQAPLVNEWEREGRKVVWIFLDTSIRMSLGNSVQNSFEYSVQAALELTEFYLSRECMVGLTLFNNDYQAGDAPLSFFYSTLKPSPAQDEIIYPDSGSEQFKKIRSRLVKVKMGASRSSLKDSIFRSRRHLLGTNPLFIVVTLVDEKSKRYLMEGLMVLEKYNGRSGLRRTNTIVVHISGLEFAERDRIVTGFQELESRVMLDELRSRGATVVRWSPSRQSFSSALLAQVKRN
jgi:uncharacterized protein (DUF58 family)